MHLTLGPVFHQAWKKNVGYLFFFFEGHRQLSGKGEYEKQNCILFKARVEIKPSNYFILVKLVDKYPQRRIIECSG